MNSTIIIALLLAALVYLEAGRQTWQNLFLRMPERSKEPMAMAVKENRVPFAIMLIWCLLWPLFMLAGYVAAHWTSSRLQPGTASPLDLK